MSQILDIEPFESMTFGRFAKLIWTWPFKDRRVFWQLMGTLLLWLLAAFVAAVVVAILFASGSEEQVGEAAGYAAAAVFVASVLYVFSKWVRMLLIQAGVSGVAVKPGLGDLIRFMVIALAVFLAASVAQSPLALMSFTFANEGKFIEYFFGFEEATGDLGHFVLDLGRAWVDTLITAAFLIYLVQGAAGIYDEIRPAMKQRLRAKLIPITNWLYLAYLPFTLVSYSIDFWPDESAWILAIFVPFLIVALGISASGLALPYCTLGLQDDGALRPIA